jgi:hypothetical protein
MQYVMAHHFAWLEAGNSIPPGVFLLHSCDNPPCVNPAHLRTGTNGDNMQDALARGRRSQAKLSPEDVRTIRKRLANGDRAKDIAPDYGVTTRPIFYIKANQKWKWLS